MSLIILFGLPGTGKTYIGKIFEKYFDFYFYDGDNDLTKEMKNNIKEQKIFTDQMRDVFFQQMIENILILKKKYSKLVISQTFIKEKYRLQVINKIPEAKFILIKTNKFLREKRLKKRTDHPLEEKYAKKMSLNFDKPIINHQLIMNNEIGAEKIIKQIQQFF